ncbi:Gfo/Idh/MocA family protein [Pedobacter frigoris]|nr:Gfo/Idh/MocA family oxidoreductase [Pedobacter frigoris]
MKLIIIGAGRMGMRHAIGAARNNNITEILLLDINASALDNARIQLAQESLLHKFKLDLFDNLSALDFSADIAIIASPAKDRKEICRLLISKGAKDILVEKPLGQNLKEVEDLSSYIESTNVRAYVNLNMRLYPSFITLRDDLQNRPQLSGYKIFSINTGSIGIGANGIHYLDMLFFLFDADEAKIVAGEIEEDLLASGRGPDYGDFGGWCTIKFFANGDEVGRAHVSITAKSSVFGNWDIIAPFGHIIINEIEQERITTLRKEDSAMPIQRYGADYLPSLKSEFVSPFLGELTSVWIDSIANGESALPSISESLKVHKLMFDWLELSQHHTVFPIT